MAKQAFLGENSTGGGHCDEGHFLQSYQPSLCNGWDSEKDLPSTSGYARFGQLTLTILKPRAPLVPMPNPSTATNGKELVCIIVA